jgi:hypothetical protein
VTDEPSGRARVNLSDADLREVFARAEVIGCAAGAHLMTKGHPGGALYLIEEGEFDIVGDEGDTEIVYAVLGPGELIGEVGFLDGYPRTRSVRAHTACRVKRLERSAIERLPVEERASFYRLLATVLARRFRNIVADVDKANSVGTESTSMPVVVRDTVPSDADVSAAVASFKDRFYEFHKSQRGSDDEVTAIAVAELMDELNDWLRRVAKGAPEAEGNHALMTVGRYIARELYPYLMRSHLLERLYVKPRGVACDYVSLERMYEGVPAGEDALGRELDAWLLQSPLIRAYRGRRRWFASALEKEATRRFLVQADGYDTIEILALEAGAARSLFDFLDACQFSDQVGVTCLDEDIEALSYANTRVNVNPHQATVRFRRERLRAFVKGEGRAHHSQKDIVYAPLACDFLDDASLSAFVARVSEVLKPGGLLLLVAHTDKTPQRVFARHVLDWHIRFRPADVVKRLVSEGFDGEVQVRTANKGTEVRISARAR